MESPWPPWPPPCSPGSPQSSNELPLKGRVQKTEKKLGEDPDASCRLWHWEIASRASADTSRASREVRNAKVSTFTFWKDLDYWHYIQPAFMGEVQKFKSVGTARYLDVLVDFGTLTDVNLVERIPPTLSHGGTLSLQLCLPHGIDLLTCLHSNTKRRHADDRSGSGHLSSFTQFLLKGRSPHCPIVGGIGCHWKKIPLT